MIIFAGLIMLVVGLGGYIFVMMGKMLISSFYYIPKIFPMFGLIAHDIFRCIMFFYYEISGHGRKRRKMKKQEQEDEINRRRNRKNKEKAENKALLQKALENRIIHLRKQYPNSHEELFDIYEEEFPYCTAQEIKEMEEIIEESHLKNTAI